ncbi:hypothetical protein CO695_12890 [Providencia alcalifaciens]|uniref:Uncharacterized protein n=1 Tax=Providencia alcalifaciens DSM 30120 TaxID=520999 RepID=B6XKQ4_9GAMM|nr:hypothetical protein [Providencia alcalifaciens]ATG17146.1 hypothetical protein CO695_12890 [Providencia alcalifaciens]EEB44087.1 hypothetical protein PROVALCAL_03964 [Providencia alcalifaciens DSM 30120]
MDFDWISATALVVGIGSLCLTYKSTTSAKRAIDTSISLYEKQKKDYEKKQEEENKRKLDAIKIIIMEDIKSNYFLFINILKIIKTISDGIDVKLSSCKFSEYQLINMNLIDSGNIHQAVYKKSNYSDSQKYLFELIQLDFDISKVFLEMKISGSVYDNLIPTIIVMIEDNAVSDNIIRNYLPLIENYKYEMELLYEMCSDKDTRHLSDYINMLSSL